MLSGSKCQACSNTYLILLLPFAAGGIVLVVFLSVLRLRLVLNKLDYTHQQILYNGNQADRV